MSKGHSRFLVKAPLFCVKISVKRFLEYVSEKTHTMATVAFDKSLKKVSNVVSSLYRNDKAKQ